MLTADSADIFLRYIQGPTSSVMMSGRVLILPLTVSAMRDWMMIFHDTGFWRKERPFRCKVNKNRADWGYFDVKTIAPFMPTAP